MGIVFGTNEIFRGKGFRSEKNKRWTNEMDLSEKCKIIVFKNERLKINRTNLQKRTNFWNKFVFKM